MYICIGERELERYLTLLHWRSVFVTHGADLHPPLSLFVALSKELLHDPLRPLLV